MSAQALTGVIVNISQNNNVQQMPGMTASTIPVKPFVANVQLENFNGMGGSLAIPIDTVDVDTYLPGSKITLTPSITS